MPSSALKEIPLEPEQISREWLFEVINQFRQSRRLGQLSSAADIVDCAIDEREQSHGHLSTTYKLLAHFKCKTFSGKEEECSYAFFLKMLPGVEEKHRKLVTATRAFQREVEAHFNILPKLRRYVLKEEEEEKSNNSKIQLAMALPVPQIVYGSYNNDDGSGIVVLMDLNDDGFFPLNHYHGFSLPQLLTVAERLAEFHAAGAAAILSDKMLLPELSQEQDSQAVFETVSPAYRDFSRFLRRVPGFFPCHELAEKARSNLVRLMSAGGGGGRSNNNSNNNSNSNNKRQRFPMRTILHGELWEKNVLLRFEQISAKLEVVFCDWKCARVGYPAQDLAFLVLSGADKSVRSVRRNVDMVLAKYLAAFKNTIIKFGIEFDKKFSLEDLRLDYEEATLEAFLPAAMVMTRELKYLEVEFYNAKEEAELETVGENLRSLGRRLLDLADEFLPKIDMVMFGSNNVLQESKGGLAAAAAAEAQRNAKVKVRA